MYLRSKDIPTCIHAPKNKFSNYGVLCSLCKLGVEITHSKFKMQEMVEMLIQDRADQVSGDSLC